MTIFQIILFSIISAFFSVHDRQSTEKEPFYFLLEKTDSLLSRAETSNRLEFQFYHILNDQNPIVFIFEKKTSFPDTLTNITNFNILRRQEINKLEKEYRTSLSKLFYFPKWLETKYSSFYLIEKTKYGYLKYKVTVAQPEVDYQLK